MKIISFNINSIRARPHQVEAIVKKHRPEAIGFQETKVHDDDFPHEIPKSLGYKAHIHGQKGHYGVAIFTKDDPIDVKKGFETDDNEDLILFISTGSVKFTATSVPPLKSMLSLGPPLVINDTAPTKISSADMQLAMNVLLIKSIFVSLTILIY